MLPLPLLSQLFSSAQENFLGFTIFSTFHIKEHKSQQVFLSLTLFISPPSYSFLNFSLLFSLSFLVPLFLCFRSHSFSCFCFCFSISFLAFSLSLTPPPTCPAPGHVTCPTLQPARPRHAVSAQSWSRDLRAPLPPRHVSRTRRGTLARGEV